MKISVVTCAYNAEKTIARTIESVLNQTYQNIEHIIIDDGSKDRTWEIAKGYQDKYPDRVIVKSIPNGGPASARNHGWSFCTGELYIPLDADDYLELDTFEKAVAVFESDPEIDICFYGYKSFDNKGNFFGFYSETMEYPKSILTGVEAFFQKIQRRIWICQGNALYSAAMLQKYGIQNPPGINHGEDLYFILRSLLAARKVGHFEGDNFCCMTRKGSMMGARVNSCFFQVLQALDELEEDVVEIYPDKAYQILPAIWAERIIEIRMILKRMIMQLSLEEYLRQTEPIRNVLRRASKSIAAQDMYQYFNRLVRLEYAVFKKSLLTYYCISKLYYRVVYHAR